MVITLWACMFAGLAGSVLCTQGHAGSAMLQIGHAVLSKSSLLSACSVLVAPYAKLAVGASKAPSRYASGAQPSSSFGNSDRRCSGAIDEKKKKESMENIRIAKETARKMAEQRENERKKQLEDARKKEEDVNRRFNNAVEWFNVLNFANRGNPYERR